MYFSFQLCEANKIHLKNVFLKLRKALYTITLQSYFTNKNAAKFLLSRWISDTIKHSYSYNFKEKGGKRITY